MIVNETNTRQRQYGVNVSNYRSPYCLKQFAKCVPCSKLHKSSIRRDILWTFFLEIIQQLSSFQKQLTNYKYDILSQCYTANAALNSTYHIL